MTDERPSGVPSAELAVHLVLDDWRLDRKLTALRALALSDGRSDGAARPGGLRRANRRGSLHRRAKVREPGRRLERGDGHRLT